VRIAQMPWSDRNRIHPAHDSADGFVFLVKYEFDCGEGAATDAVSRSALMRRRLNKRL